MKVNSRDWDMMIKISILISSMIVLSFIYIYATYIINVIK
jgi:hypothetical protein